MSNAEFGLFRLQPQVLQKFSSMRRAARLFLVLTVLMGVQTSLFALQPRYARVSLAMLKFTIISVGLLLLLREISQRWSGLEVRLREDAIERRSGGVSERLGWQEIRQATITQDDAGTVSSVQLRTPTSTMVLDGFTEMNRLAEAITKRIACAPTIQRQRSKTQNGSNPKLAYIIGVGMVLTTLCFRLLPTRLVDTLVAAALFLTGLWLVLWHPVSKRHGKIFRRIEWLAGGWLILLVLLGLPVKFR